MTSICDVSRVVLEPEISHRFSETQCLMCPYDCRKFEPNGNRIEGSVPRHDLQPSGDFAL